MPKLVIRIVVGAISALLVLGSVTTWIWPGRHRSAAMDPAAAAPRSGMRVDDITALRNLTADELQSRNVGATVDGKAISAQAIANFVAGQGQSMLSRQSIHRVPDTSQAIQSSASNEQAVFAGLAQAVFDQVLYLESVAAGLEVSTQRAEAYASEQLIKARQGGPQFDQYRPEGKSWDQVFTSPEALRTTRRMLTIVEGWTKLVQPAGGPRDSATARRWLKEALPRHRVEISGVAFTSDQIADHLK